MRRLPIYFLVDVSESMVGTPIEQLQEGMRTIIQNLRVDPYALETVFVSIIAFAGKAKILSPLTELYKFYPSTFRVLAAATSMEWSFVNVWVSSMLANKAITNARGVA